jgi:hypothetical protein
MLVNASEETSMPEDLPVVICRLDGGPSLVIEGASSFAHAFFSGSSAASVGDLSCLP